ncbi:unnamed protein product [Rhizophagus irregularis]|nr:unnamed protein product [Rhizophagus irregularis]
MDIHKNLSESFGQKNLALLGTSQSQCHSMPTPVCPRIFSKIEDLNPEISINVWEWERKLVRQPQRVELPVKDFEADNRKCNENYGGNMHKIMEQKANSFCYMVHWIETDETWGPFLYRGPNATEEFVRRLDKELRRINEVLEVKVERIVTEEAKRNSLKQLVVGYLQIEAWKTPIPVVFHNFRGYDSHLVCESVGRSIGAHQIKSYCRDIRTLQIHEVLLEERSLRIITNMRKSLEGIWLQELGQRCIIMDLTPSHYVSAPALSWDDANNLYGWAMSQYLPIGNYRWEASPEYFKQNPDKQKQILNTYDYLQDLPPAVDNGGRFPETEKLVPHLGKHEDYVIHYQELQYYIKLGMVVDEITQVLSFDQDNWLAPYIAKNTNLRQQSKNSFEKDFFKLMNNSVYGKTMENVRKYQDVKLMRMINENDEKKFLKKICKPSFKYARQLGNTLVGAHMGKASVILNKPIIIGASVLGLSKLLMYRFWYGFVKRKDIYKDMAERPDLFDLNDTKTIGLFKDETPGNVITESYHIRAKSYHYVLADKSTKSKHKGVSKKGMSDMAKDTYFPSLGGTLLDDTVEKDEIFDPMTQVYRDCLFENNIFYAKNVGMRTKNHVISLIESEKKALSPIDTKRWIWSDGIILLTIRTLAYSSI